MSETQGGLDVQDTTKPAETAAPAAAAIAAVEAFTKRSTIAKRDDVAETVAVKPKAAAAPAEAPVAPPVAQAEAPEPDEAMAEHLERLAGGPAAAGKPTRKELLRDQLAARGLSEGMVKTLVDHGKTKEIEGWLAQPAVLPSKTDSARQPSATPEAAPATQEFDVRAVLAGVKESLVDSGLLERRDSESLVGLLTHIADRQDRIESASVSAREADEARASTLRVSTLAAELRTAREGLAGLFPSVLDDATYYDRVAPVLTALATSPATSSRSLKDNLAAACRAALHETTDADRRSRELQAIEGSRLRVESPRSGPPSTQTITQAQFLGETVNLRRTLGANAGEAIAEFTERWKGRVKG